MTRKSEVLVAAWSIAKVPADGYGSTSRISAEDRRRICDIWFAITDNAYPISQVTYAIMFTGILPQIGWSIWKLHLSRHVARAREGLQADKAALVG